MRQQVDRAPTGARQQVGQSAQLIAVALGEEPVGGGLDQLIAVADGDDRAGEDAHLDGTRRAVVVEIGGLVGDVEIDVDDFTGNRGARRQQRNLLRLPRPAVRDRAAVQPTDETDRPGVDVAQEGARDHGNHHDDEADDDRDSNPTRDVHIV